MLVAGARPNFPKVAALERALSQKGWPVCLVHTGQHYDRDLSDVFFEQLGMPVPDHQLGVGSSSHGDQTGRIMIGFEPILMAEQPGLVLVVGDVNSTLACSIVTAKAVYPDDRRPLLGHVEAGLRSFDRSMPEEINRVLTDHVSDLLFVSEPTGMVNLEAEGIDPARCRLVGNVMIDTLRRLEDRARRTQVPEKLGLAGKEFGLATLHRPANVDRSETLGPLIEALTKIGERLPLLLAAHPRTQKALADQGLAIAAEPGPEWAEKGGLAVSGPLPYLDFLGLMARAAVVLTDSGGIQEETTALGVPCLTLRPNTERPITIDQGTNTLVTSAEKILPAFEAALGGKKGQIPDLWDGHAAERIEEVIRGIF